MEGFPSFLRDKARRLGVLRYCIPNIPGIRSGGRVDRWIYLSRRNLGNPQIELRSIGLHFGFRMRKCEFVRDSGSKTRISGFFGIRMRDGKAQTLSALLRGTVFKQQLFQSGPLGTCGTKARRSRGVRTWYPRNGDTIGELADRQNLCHAGTNGDGGLTRIMFQISDFKMETLVPAGQRPPARRIRLWYSLH